MTSEDRRLLGLALDLALRGSGGTSPNPLVGAVVARDGAVVGTGHHSRAGGEHAETIALRAAGSRASGADLYVSLEPCCRHRRLSGPSCVEAIVGAGVGRVVAAARDPNPTMDGRGLRALEAAGVRVEPEDACFARRAAGINEVFFKFVGTGLPFVVLKAGMTLDGKIAPVSRASRWITGEEARCEARSLRRLHDAVLVGIGTVLADDPLLLPAEADSVPAGEDLAPLRSKPLEEPAARAGRPARVVLDSRLRLPLASRLVASARQAPVIVFASEDADPARRSALEERGVTVVQKGRGRAALPGVLADLAGRDLTSVLVEGGGEVLGEFLSGGHADKLHLFVAPGVLGGREGVSVFGGETPLTLEGMVALDGVRLRRAGQDLVVEGYPVRGPGVPAARPAAARGPAAPGEA